MIKRLLFFFIVLVLGALIGGFGGLLYSYYYPFLGMMGAGFMAMLSVPAGICLGFLLSLVFLLVLYLTGTLKDPDQLDHNDDS